jgi:hypothetical protein
VDSIKGGENLLLTAGFESALSVYDLPLLAA